MDPVELSLAGKDAVFCGKDSVKMDDSRCDLFKNKLPEKETTTTQQWKATQMW